MVPIDISRTIYISEKRGQVYTKMKIIVVTATYKRFERIPMISHLMSILNRRNDVTWIIVEDGDKKDERLEEILPDYAIYMNIGPTNDHGSVQRNLALEYIFDNNLEGIIYNADDDNRYLDQVFDEIKKTKMVSVLPVGNLGPNGVEKPIIVDGKLIGWDANWLDRKFPVDMGGFAFNSKLLKDLKKPFWEHVGLGGESEFISKIITSTDEIEFLCDNCTKVCVWHNELKKLFMPS